MEGSNVRNKNGRKYMTVGNERRKDVKKKGREKERKEGRKERSWKERKEEGQEGTYKESVTRV